MLARGILGSGRTCGVSFQTCLNSSGWWWLISSVVLIRISCHKTTHANGYYGAWPGWVACATRKDSELEWLAKDHPETNPITIKPETVSHAAEQFSWVPLPSCSPPGCSFPIKSLALSAHVSPRTIHFRVLDKSPVSGPGRRPPSCNISVSSAFCYTEICWVFLYISGLLSILFSVVNFSF